MGETGNVIVDSETGPGMRSLIHWQTAANYFSFSPTSRASKHSILFTDRPHTRMLWEQSKDSSSEFPGSLAAEILHWCPVPPLVSPKPQTLLRNKDIYFSI
eukprot:GHVU01080451.1.p1 GENE.GHVU01080451.1~~GHVU01080451.1.p1  ORF type:complete len:101 (-),score=2.35 GHVU01080451.1:164-466(-)